MAQYCFPHFKSNSYQNMFSFKCPRTIISCDHTCGRNIPPKREKNKLTRVHSKLDQKLTRKQICFDKFIKKDILSNCLFIFVVKTTWGNQDGRSHQIYIAYGWGDHKCDFSGFAWRCLGPLGVLQDFTTEKVCHYWHIA